MLPIIYRPAFENYIKRIKDKRLVGLFCDGVTEIRKDPTLGEMKVGDLAGICCYVICCQKTKYEIAYHVVRQEDEVIVVILMAGTRENFYQDLKRYMK